MLVDLSLESRFEVILCVDSESYCLQVGEVLVQVRRVPQIGDDLSKIILSACM